MVSMVGAAPLSVEAIERYAGLLWRPGEVRELRVLGGPTQVGYFEKPETLARAAVAFDGKRSLYVTINPVEPALLARAVNRVVRAREAASDKDILVRRFLPVDIDPIRPSGISATQEEVDASLATTRLVAEYLLEQGWGLPITSFSGNGHQLLYPIELPNDQASTALVAGILRHLAAGFDDERVKIDTSVSNAARIMALIGTLKVKGDHTSDRPHRRSAIIHVPDRLVVIPSEALAALVPEEADGSPHVRVGGKNGETPGWVRRRLDAAGIVYREQPPDAVGIVWYHVESCPYHPDDGDPWQCGVGEAPDGRATGKCFHDRGEGKGWQEFKRDLGLGPATSFDEAGVDDGEEPDMVVEPPDVAHSERILDLVAETVASLGVAGEERAVRLIYLVIVTRLLDRIVSLAVKGTSSGGKSWLVGSVLRLFPASAYHALSAFSERALIYDDAPLEHRMLVIYEAAGMAGEMQTYIVRSLLSEGRVRYVTVEKGKGGLRPRTIEREGPTGLITTTTEVKLHPENETRLLSLTISDTPEQTRAILLAQAHGVTDPVDLGPWHQLQTWLSQNSDVVSIPWLRTLAMAIPPVAVRLRRDFPAIIALIQAHALLHQLSRDRDEDGSVVATFEDYAVVRDLVGDLVADAAEQAVPESVRETVAWVITLTDGGEETTVAAVAKALGLDKSSASRRVRSAIDRGFVKNLQERRGRPLRLVRGDPLLEERTVLPDPAELERLHGCSEDEGDIPDADADTKADTPPSSGPAFEHEDGPIPAAASGIPTDATATVQPQASTEDAPIPAAASDTPTDPPATVQPQASTEDESLRLDDDRDLHELRAEAEATFADLGGAWLPPPPDDDRGALGEDWP